MQFSKNFFLLFACLCQLNSSEDPDHNGKIWHLKNTLEWFGWQICGICFMRSMMKGSFTKTSKFSGRWYFPIPCSWKEVRALNFKWNYGLKRQWRRAETDTNTTKQLANTCSLAPKHDSWWMITHNCRFWLPHENGRLVVLKSAWSGLENCVFHPEI